MTDQIECPDCDGEGVVKNPNIYGYGFRPDPADTTPSPEPTRINCAACVGEGWRAPTDDELADMAERQAEDAASGEPPVTMQEQYIDAWTMKQALRR